MKLLRWLARVPVPMMLFALSMNIAHIGSEWLCVGCRGAGSCGSCGIDLLPPARAAGCGAAVTPLTELPISE
jgi:hypothetical protein